MSLPKLYHQVSMRRQQPASLIEVISCILSLALLSHRPGAQAEVQIPLTQGWVSPTKNRRSYNAGRPSTNRLGARQSC